MRTATVGEMLDVSRKRLAPVSETAGLDGQVLLAKVMGKEKTWILAHPEAVLSDIEREKLEQGLSRLAAGEPLAYVLGEWEFFGLKLKVSPTVLIPRPETELLVETAINWLSLNPGLRKALDVGTGSGCIPVAIAHNIDDVHFVATDISPDAIEIAQQNVARYELGQRISLVETYLTRGVRGNFDLITANLPYIPDERLPSLAVSKWEPRLALGGGPDGLRFIEPFLRQAEAKLSKHGIVLAEIDASLEGAVINLANSLFPQAEIEVRKDLAGLPRLLVVQI